MALPRRLRFVVVRSDDPVQDSMGWLFAYVMPDQEDFDEGLGSEQGHLCGDRLEGTAQRSVDWLKRHIGTL